jgi:hypothetical protein
MSDDTWLSAAGYSSLSDFMVFHELTIKPAKKLLNAFRDAHQRVWARVGVNIHEKPEHDEEKWAADRRGVWELDQLEVEIVVYYHELMAHMSLFELKEVARNGKHGMPGFMQWFLEKDVPVCEVCKAKGKADRWDRVV